MAGILIPSPRWHGDGAREMEGVWIVRNDSENEGTARDNGDSGGNSEAGEQLPLSVEINWTASRLPSLLVEPVVSLHKFTFTTSFSIGPTFPAPDGDEIADLFDDEFTIVGGGQINEETVLVATSPTSDVRIAIDGRAVDILVAASFSKWLGTLDWVLRTAFRRLKKGWMF